MPGPPDGLATAAATLPPTMATTQPPQPAPLGAPRTGTPAPVFGAPRAPSRPPTAVDPFAGLSSGSAAAPRPADPFAPRIPSQPSTPGPLNPAPLAAPPLADPFAALVAPPTRPTAPPAAVDPFAALTRAPTAPPAPADPFAALTQPPRPADPFATLAPPAAPPPALSDPFAALVPPPVTGLTASAPPRAADPFASTAPPAAADPFAAVTAPPAPVDPFAAFGTAAPTASASQAPAPDPFGMSAARPSPFAGPSGPDPFGDVGAPPAAPADPFGLTPGTGAFGGPPAAGANPFGSRPPVDPFGNDDDAGQPDPFAGGLPFGAQRSPTPMPPVPHEDPFADENSGPGVGQPFDADARAALFGISPPPPAVPSTRPTPANPAAGSGLELVTPPTTTPPMAPPVASWAERLVPAVRIIAAAAQVLALVAVTVVAIVIGRGGSIGALLSLDPAGAFAVGQAPEDGLVIEDVSVSTRHTSSGLSLVVISGFVHLTGDKALPGVVVEATVGGVVARGHAWTGIDGIAIDQAKTDQDLAVLQASRTSSPTVSPGDRAPFVIVAHRPTDLDHVVLKASPFAEAPAPPPPPPPEPAPVVKPVKKPARR